MILYYDNQNQIKFYIIQNLKNQFRTDHLNEKHELLNSKLFSILTEIPLL